jgi:hypothetical protein
MLVFAHTVLEYNQDVITANISQTCFILSQSVLVMANMVQGMCLTTWPLRRIVVMGPYRWSAVETKRVIAWQDKSARRRDEEKQKRETSRSQ